VVLLPAAIPLSTVSSIGIIMIFLQREQAYKKKEAVVIAIAVTVFFSSAEVGLGLLCYYYGKFGCISTGYIDTQTIHIVIREI
jgi:NADH:ubiquinone oxidoreductase subunit K